MKKVLSFVLALVMVLALSVTAFAANGIPNTGDGEFPGSRDDIDITASFTDNKDVVNHKYHVTVAWNTTGSISYTKGYTTYTWNPGETKYESTVTDAKWDVQNASIAITVTNRSDGAIKAVCGEPVEKTNGTATITGIYDSASEGTLSLGSAAGETYTAPGAPVTKTATYSITDVTGSIDKSGTIATITVTVSADKTGGQTT